MKAKLLDKSSIPPERKRKKPGGLKRIPLQERFWRHVEGWSLTDCWLWTGYLERSGYGSIGLGGEGAKVAKAHRVSFMLFVGPIPDGFLVCHHCDVRHCVNPRHLYLGTSAQNNHDMAVRKRAAAGERHPRAKLTAKEVEKIRALHEKGIPQKIIAKQFDVRQCTVSSIIRHETWR